MKKPEHSLPLVWRRLTVRGAVQGVGFRPAVWRHAVQMGLRGTVRNTLGAVVIEIGGPAARVEEFTRSLPEAMPRIAHIESLDWESMPPRDAPDFRIAESQASDRADMVIPPDLATCEDCLAEIFSDGNRRAGYAFTSCTQCGPRYTMVESLPYDRERTAMRDFPLCADCAREYADPADRRYHAESSACPRCGPQLKLESGACHSPSAHSALERAVEWLKQGRIGAVKGIGGFHLVCDALNPAPVEGLRRRKRRPGKPFALMAASASAAARYVELGAEERLLLESPERPVVLLRKRAECAVPESIAPGNRRLGIMLPYTPLHHLLMREFELLVMTSANESEEPILHEDEAMRPWLGPIVDFILMHNRRIWNKCDDSVLLLQSGQPTLVRRARGYVPLPMEAGGWRPEVGGNAEGKISKPEKSVIRDSQSAMPCSPLSLQPPASSLQPLLACGGDLKNVFALARGERIYMSTHMGDLANPAALDHYRRQIDEWTRLLQIQPAVVVHDLHPGYHSTQFALELPAETHLAVQHHHAHLAACLADNRCAGPAIGVIFDGTGYGLDGSIWGGEFLVGDAAGFVRAACLKPIPMPGGDKAIQEPWRMALAALADAVGLERAVAEVVARMPAGGEAKVESLGRMLKSGAPFPLTSSAGRLFDILGFLLGLGDRVTFEAQHAMAVEALAECGMRMTEPRKRWPIAECGMKFEIRPSGVEIHDSIQPLPSARYSAFRIPHSVFLIDPAPLWQGVLERQKSGVPAESIAAAFHAAWIEMIAQVCLRLSELYELRTVACSGGVFLNTILAEGVRERLAALGLEGLFHRQVPPGDGGLAYGQAIVGMTPNIFPGKCLI